jgi:hypothetical protein
MGKKNKCQASLGAFAIGLVVNAAIAFFLLTHDRPTYPVFKSGQKVTNGICTGLVTRKMAGDEYMVMNAKCGDAWFNYLVIPTEQLKAAE